MLDKVQDDQWIDENQRQCCSNPDAKAHKLKGKRMSEECSGELQTVD